MLALLASMGCGTLDGPGNSATVPLRPLPGTDKAKQDSFRKDVEADPFPRAEKLGL